MALKMNIKRWWFRLYSKMVSEKATPQYIARGWAIGMFYGCLIPFGFQLILSIPSSFLLKGSKIGATLGTLITNHFTIFIIYPVQCFVGNRIIGGSISYSMVKQAVADLLKKQEYSAFVDMGIELTVSFFVGGALLAAIMTPLTYFVVKTLVTSRQNRKKTVSK